ncbi:MAG: LysM peptidoglycan-binding domain-containing protein [Desulfobacterales bacterium]|jgi:LysM repeat protein
MKESRNNRTSKMPIRGSRGDRRWAMVFIGAHSKTIAFNHLKAAVVLTALIILALGGLAGGLVYLYQRAAGDIRTLENKVVELNQAMQSLRDEKDILMARLVLTESISGKKPSRTKPDKRDGKSNAEKAALNPPDENETASMVRNSEKTIYHTVESGDSLYAIGFRYNVSVGQLRRLNHMEGDSTLHPGDRLVIKSESGEEMPLTDQEGPVDQPPVETAHRLTQAAGATGKDIGADVRNFTTVYEMDTKALRVEYVIRNNGSKSQQISGQTVVVLRSEGDSPDSWLVLPPVPLESGKPEGKLGSAFSIYNFRTIRFKVNDQEDADRYKLATVYVFSTDGNLALEKEFPVSIDSRPRQ